MVWLHIDGLAQDCSNPIANLLELPQACTEPSISYYVHDYIWFVIIYPCPDDSSGLANRSWRMVEQ